MGDWQNIAVLIAVSAALVYAAFRAWKRFKAFRLSRDGSSCDTGCGSCGSETPRPSAKRTVFVELSRIKPSAPRK